MAENRLVLLNLCHGGLPIDQNTRFVTTEAPTNLFRLIKASISACCIATKYEQIRYFTVIAQICNTPYYTHTDTRMDDDDTFMGECKTRLTRNSTDLTSRSSLLEHPLDRSLSECTNNFEYLKTNKTNQIINKVWSTDVNGGIIIMSDVTFELPYTPRNEVDRSLFNYKIGKLILIEGKTCIQYIQNTNLLTCPYFIGYYLNIIRANLSIEIDVSRHLVEYKSIVCDERAPMPKSINAKILYNYFQHVPKIFHLDMSCEGLVPLDSNIINILQSDPIKYKEIQNYSSARGGSKRRKKSRRQTKSKQKKSRKPRK